MDRPIPPAVLEAVRLAWREYDDARDRGDLAHAQAILRGLDERARSLGLPDAWALSNR